ncbi:MAG: outer membrane lipoprotein-sorting protein [bacterium]
MKARTLVAICLAAVVPLAATGYGVSADDLAPGEVINKDNWQKVEGLLPDPVLEWVKEGKFPLTIGKINYNPADALPDYALKARETNDGLYDINEKNELVNKKTGEPARELVGHPFPTIDPADPKAATKVMYNGMLSRLIAGNIRMRGMVAHYLDSSSQERELEALFKVASLVGYPGAKDISNPNDYEQLNIILVTRPFDLAGTAVMMLRYFGSKPDSNFAYAPAIRRVRRMSPANRSDSLFGSDYSMDDSGYTSYDGKIPAFDFKLLAKTEILTLYLGSDPYPVNENEDGEWCAETKSTLVTWGYNQKDRDGLLSWAPLNVIAVKRPVYQIECTSKDPFYNYGKQVVWIDADMYVGCYKQILNRAGEQWKMLFNVWTMGESADKKFRTPVFPCGVMVDRRAEHATVFEFLNPGCPWCLNTKDDLNDYSLGGFQKFCK